VSRCDAELCPHWTGQGCICDVLDLQRDGTATRTLVSEGHLRPDHEDCECVKRTDVSPSPPYARHLMTFEATPREVNFLPSRDEFWFLSRCICGHDIAAGPYPQTMKAVEEHLQDGGLLPGATATERKD